MVLYYKRTVVVVIVWYLDVLLTMQSVSITTNFVSSNPAQAAAATLCDKVCR